MRNVSSHSIYIAPRTSRTQASALVLGVKKARSSSHVSSVYQAYQTEDVSTSIVGGSPVSLRKMLALFLAFLLIGNPLLVVYAQEGEDAGVAQDTATIQENVNQQEAPQDSVSVETPEEANQQNDVVENAVAEDASETPPEESQQQAEQHTSENNNEASSSEVVDSNITASTAGDETDSATDVVTDTPTEQPADVLDEDDENQVEENKTSTYVDPNSMTDLQKEVERLLGTTTAQENKNILTTEEEREEVNDQNRFLFSKQQCVQMEDGFFCTTKEKATSTNEASIATDRVFVEIDAQGDKEIALLKGGVKQMITDNGDDDDKPFYDPASGTIVWQTLINDRYQIMSFNINSNERRQLTGTSYNNTTPYVYKNTVVWQGWVEDNWEIFMETIASTASSTTSYTERITDNAWDDMFPQVFEKGVTWQAFIDGKWQVFVYDFSTKTSTLVGEGDGEYTNPRLMLVIDNKKENGDIAVVGYDPATGEITPLGASPAPTPQSAPEAPLQDQTAVLGAGAQVNQKTEKENITGGSGDGNGDDPVLGDEEQTASSTIVLLDDVSTAPSTYDGVTQGDIASSTDFSIEPLVLNSFVSSTTTPQE